MSGQQLDPQIIQQILSMLKQQNSDPFQRPLPGEGILGTGGFAQHLPNAAPMYPMSNDNQISQNTARTIPTDFANTQPGLPNLPDTFTGFGFGQFAPKQIQPIGVRQKLIQQLLGLSQAMKPGAFQSSQSPMQTSISGGFS